MDDSAASVDPSRPSARTVFAQMRRHLPPYLALTGKLAGRGAVETSGQGCRVRLSDGRSALDFGSYAVTLLGHRHPAVLTAVRDQLDALPVATRTLANPATAAAAARLVEYFDSELTRVCFGVSGADAVEAAVKLARLASGRSRIVAVQGGFHGKSLGALALTHHERYRTGLLDVLPGVVHVPADDPDAVAREVARDDVAAVVFEPVQGENGVRPLDPDVLAAWCAAATAHGTFVIADEIQCGLRRCGEPSPALAAGLPVDAVLVGKPLGGGVLPVSAAVCRERLYAPLLADPIVHTSTFAGHPLGCAAVPAALDTIEELADRGPVLAGAMADGLAELRRGHPETVTAVRGRGLLWGIDLDPPHLAGELVVQLAQAGLLVSPCMSRPGTLRLMPPLVAGTGELSEALGILAAVVARAAAGGRAAGVPSGAPTAP
ncbi:aspartate aminotransferase family protein [Plantactinospora sp. KLBMP9567]|uniref:aspartate aminotransferase family protein n=1 Tax=Plantactinospora sp. KLBMP9567 TaxID=3085900 RepID=UPI002980EB81|nr:aminotransferase class III-fold pyridoxal phosphate-dependent enzyme [Plantactinospora sp. KLBMP9567]MDW5324838.1 aminotransferase class III-fold pyridoxal phosphate-dependent enzyme [Plantactinospora sp. KLBMP9567]